MTKDYEVAGFRIRVVASAADLVADYSLVGFRPFEVEVDPSQRATVELHLDESVTPAAFDGFEVLDSSYLADADTNGYFGRYDKGYMFYMGSTADDSMCFVREFDSNVVRCNATAMRDVEFADSLLRFGIWIMFGLAIIPLGAIAVHSSVVAYRGAAAMFLGESGTGKSTHTRLWRENIEGAKLLNDDSPILRVEQGEVYAYGSPWSGKTHCYKRVRLPLRAMVRLSQSPRNNIRKLSTVAALGALLPSCPPNFAHDADVQDALYATLSAVLGKVECYHLECLPDAAAAQLSCKTIFGSDEQ